MLKIIYVVLMVIGLVFQPWPGSPLAQWPWGGWVLYWLLFAVLGLAVFGGI